MTTPTPTSNPAGGASAFALPDAESLARLANEFFSALPGAAPGAASLIPPAPPVGSVPGASTPVLSPPAGGLPHPGLVRSLPSEPAHAQALAAAAPPGVPNAQSQNGVPDHVLTALPATESRLGGAVLGVPQAYAASLPLGATVRPAYAPFQAPSSPYYFLGESSAAVAPARPEAPVAARPGPSFYFLEPALAPAAHPAFDVDAVRRDFPILSERVNGRPLVWFDNAATTQKPQPVIDRLAYFYEHENSNIHRAAHELAARATDAYEAARDKVARFLGASSPEEIIFVRGATEAINLVAQSWGRKHIGAGDEIIVSHLEHHANIVPWQQLAAEKGARIRVIPVDGTGQVLIEEYTRLLNERTRLVAVTQVSNALGTVVPVKEIVALAHRAGAKALVDGAQSVSHMRVNVQDLDSDFFVFSGHKIFGPTGIGVVHGKRAVLEDTPPWQGGGNMISDVTFERTTYQAPPTRFEAGTGNIADAVGLGAALDYIERIGIENISRYEHGLLEYATRGLLAVPGLKLIGTAPDRAGVLSFVLDGHPTQDVGEALSREGIAVRAGHHCAQPILRRFGLETTVRPSLAFYNTCAEIDQLAWALRKLANGRGRG